MDSSGFSIDNSFWGTMEDILHENIPLYLKRIITAAGYARYDALKQLSEKQKTDIELFAREHMTMFPKNSENFHIYYGNPREFWIVPGHWQLLCELSKKLPENKKLFLKHKRIDSTLRTDPSRDPQNMTPVKLKKTVNERSSGSGEENGAQGIARGLKDSAQDKSLDKSSQEASLMIQSKIKTWLKAKGLKVPVNIAVEILGPRRATVLCFQCNKAVALSTRENKNGSWGWIISNYNQHLLQHMPNKNTISNYFHQTARSDKDVSIQPASKIPSPLIQPSVSTSVPEYDPEFFTTETVPVTIPVDAESTADLVGAPSTLHTADEELIEDAAQEIEYVVYEDVEEEVTEGYSGHPSYRTETFVENFEEVVELAQDHEDKNANEAMDSEIDSKTSVKTLLEIVYA